MKFERQRGLERGRNSVVPTSSIGLRGPLNKDLHLLDDIENNYSYANVRFGTPEISDASEVKNRVVHNKDINPRKERQPMKKTNIFEIAKASPEQPLMINLD